MSRRPWLVFGVLAFVQFMVVLDAGIVNIALPSIKSDLGFGDAELTWVVDAYLLTFGGFLLLGGRAADLLGRRRLFVAGLIIFTLASLACGLALQAWHLLAGRAVQGIGAALVSPAALALVTDVFSEGPRRNRALGIWGSMGGIAGAAGVLIGGLLTQIGWQWAFLVNVPIGVATLGCARLLPPSRRMAAGSVGLVNALTGTGGLVLLIYALVGGLRTAGSWAVLGMALILLAYFVWHQSRTALPLVPVALLRMRSLLSANGLNALVGAVLFAMFFVVTLYLQNVLGFSPLAAGLIYLPVNLALLAGAQVAPGLIGRLGAARVLTVGFGLQAAGLAWWAWELDHQAKGVLVSFVLPMMLWCLGLGLSVVSSFVLCTSGVGGELAGVAAGLVTTTLNIGGATGLAIIGSISKVGATSAEGYTFAAVCGAAICLAGCLVSFLAGPLISRARTRVG